MPSPRFWPHLTTNRPTDSLRQIWRGSGQRSGHGLPEFRPGFPRRQGIDLAVKALERGLIYDEDNSQISLLLADILRQAEQGRPSPGPGRSSHRASDPVCRSLRAAGQGLEVVESREGDHSSAGSRRPARFQERSASIFPGRSLPRDRPERQGGGPLQRAFDLAADAPDLSRAVAIRS